MFPHGFSWDPKKNVQNQKEHGIDFNDACKAFSSITIENIDDRFAYGEERLNALGEMGGFVVHISYTQRGETKHLISARQAELPERETYLEYQRELDSQFLSREQHEYRVDTLLAKSRRRRQKRKKDHSLDDDFEPDL